MDGSDCRCARPSPLHDRAEAPAVEHARLERESASCPGISRDGARWEGLALRRCRTICACCLRAAALVRMFAVSISARTAVDVRSASLQNWTSLPI